MGWRMSRLFGCFALAALLVLAGCGLAGCGRESGARAGSLPAGKAASSRTELVLASTTSTQDSGLFEVLIPAFEAAYPYRVKVIAAGSGEALKLGETGDADVLLVHSPAAEEVFMQQGFGLERRAVMHNDFVLVGPISDPAGVKDMKDAAAALAAIARAEAPFFSRADQSGTYARELSLWETAGVVPQGDWYKSTGQGMGETLTIADQSGGYTLSDRATYLSKKASLSLEVLVQGDKALLNQYHVITVKKARNLEGARAFLNWIVSPQVQNGVIATFGVEKFGEPLFVPNAGQSG